MTGGRDDGAELFRESSTDRISTKMARPKIGPQIVGVMPVVYYFMEIAGLNCAWRSYPNASGIMSSNLKTEQKMERYQKGLPLLGRPRLLNQSNKKAENILKKNMMKLKMIKGKR